MKKAAAIIMIALSLVSSSVAQRRNADREAAIASQNLGPAAATADESDAFKAIQGGTDDATRLAASDAFLAAYAASQLAGIVNRLRMDVFINRKQYKEAAVAGEAGFAQETRYVESVVQRADADAANPGRRDRDAPPAIDKNSPGFKDFIARSNAVAMYYYQRLTLVYRELNDAPKALEFAEKAYAANHEEISVLVTLAQLLSENQPDEQAMMRAEEIARKAVIQVTALVSSPAGAGLPAAQKTLLLSAAHSTMGRVYLNQKRYDDAQRSYLAAIAARKDDPIAYLLLGVAYAKQSPPKVDDAMEAWAKSVYLKGNTEKQAREFLQNAYQEEKKSLEGLDQFIQAAGDRIGP
jgi:tetratricopeptide (TPR) repeat protein